MRRSQAKPDQLDLFGSTGRTRLWQTPQWQNLPHPVRHNITKLMARLLMEHGTNHQAVRDEEAGNLRHSVESHDA
ncbi:MAG: hypothetical protein RIE06_31845 [Roseibium album]|uniref:hypothetical protein n=1 Tax=Roseibium album TaxID=311410 RepID=UPI0032EF8B73